MSDGFGQQPGGSGFGQQPGGWGSEGSQQRALDITTRAMALDEEFGEFIDPQIANQLANSAMSTQEMLAAAGQYYDLANVAERKQALSNAPTATQSYEWDRLSQTQQDLLKGMGYEPPAAVAAQEEANEGWFSKIKGGVGWAMGGVASGLGAVFGAFGKGGAETLDTMMVAGDTISGHPARQAFDMDPAAQLSYDAMRLIAAKDELEQQTGMVFEHEQFQQMGQWYAQRHNKGYNEFDWKKFDFFAGGNMSSEKGEFLEHWNQQGFTGGLPDEDILRRFEQIALDLEQDERFSSSFHAAWERTGKERGNDYRDPTVRLHVLTTLLGSNMEAFEVVEWAATHESKEPGATVADYVTEVEGISPDDPRHGIRTAFLQKLYLADGTDGAEALKLLRGDDAAKYSVGRDFAQRFGGQTPGTGGFSFMSGGIDALHIVFFDPFNALGSATKTARGAMGLRTVTEMTGLAEGARAVRNGVPYADVVSRDFAKVEDLSAPARAVLTGTDPEFAARLGETKLSPSILRPDEAGHLTPAADEIEQHMSQLHHHRTDLWQRLRKGQATDATAASIEAVEEAIAFLGRTTMPEGAGIRGIFDRKRLKAAMDFDELAELIAKAYSSPEQAAKVRLFTRDVPQLGGMRGVLDQHDDFLRNLPGRDGQGIASADDVWDVATSMDGFTALAGGRASRGGRKAAPVHLPRQTKAKKAWRMGVNAAADLSADMSTFGKGPDDPFWAKLLPVRVVPNVIGTNLMMLGARNPETILPLTGRNADIMFERFSKLGLWAGMKRPEVAKYVDEWLAAGDTVGLHTLEDVAVLDEFGDAVDVAVRSAGQQSQAMVRRHDLVERFIKDMLDHAMGGKLSKRQQDFINKVSKNAEQYKYSLEGRAVNPATGKEIPLWPMGQYSNQVAIPAFKDLAENANQIGLAQRGLGKLNNHVVDAMMSRGWKPAMLLRIGFPIRAFAEEAMAYVAFFGTESVEAVMAHLGTKKRRGLFSGGLAAILGRTDLRTSDEWGELFAKADGIFDEIPEALNAADRLAYEHQFAATMVDARHLLSADHPQRQAMDDLTRQIWRELRDEYNLLKKMGQDAKVPDEVDVAQRVAEQLFTRRDRFALGVDMLTARAAMVHRRWLQRATDIHSLRAAVMSTNDEAFHTALGTKRRLEERAAKEIANEVERIGFLRRIVRHNPAVSRAQADISAASGASLMNDGERGLSADAMLPMNGPYNMGDDVAELITNKGPAEMISVGGDNMTAEEYSFAYQQLSHDIVAQHGIDALRTIVPEDVAQAVGRHVEPTAIAGDLFSKPFADDAYLINVFGMDDQGGVRYNRGRLIEDWETKNLWLTGGMRNEPTSAAVAGALDATGVDPNNLARLLHDYRPDPAVGMHEFAIRFQRHRIKAAGGNIDSVDVPEPLRLALDQQALLATAQEMGFDLLTLGRLSDDPVRQLLNTRIVPPTAPSYNQYRDEVATLINRKVDGTITHEQAVRLEFLLPMDEETGFFTEEFLELATAAGGWRWSGKERPVMANAEALIQTAWQVRFGEIPVRPRGAEYATRLPDASLPTPAWDVRDYGPRPHAGGADGRISKVNSDTGKLETWEGPEYSGSTDGNPPEPWEHTAKVGDSQYLTRTETWEGQDPESMGVFTTKNVNNFFAGKPRPPVVQAPSSPDAVDTPFKRILTGQKVTSTEYGALPEELVGVRPGAVVQVTNGANSQFVVITQAPRDITDELLEATAETKAKWLLTEGAEPDAWTHGQDRLRREGQAWQYGYRPLRYDEAPSVKDLSQAKGDKRPMVSDHAKAAAASAADAAVRADAAARPPRVIIGGGRRGFLAKSTKPGGGRYEGKAAMELRSHLRVRLAEAWDGTGTPPVLLLSDDVGASKILADEARDAGWDVTVFDTPWNNPPDEASTRSIALVFDKEGNPVLDDNGKQKVFWKIADEFRTKLMLDRARTLTGGDLSQAEGWMFTHTEGLGERAGKLSASLRSAGVPTTGLTRAEMDAARAAARTNPADVPHIEFYRPARGANLDDKRTVAAARNVFVAEHAQAEVAIGLTPSKLGLSDHVTDQRVVYVRLAKRTTPEEIADTLGPLVRDGRQFLFDDVEHAQPAINFLMDEGASIGVLTEGLTPRHVKAPYLPADPDPKVMWVDPEGARQPRSGYLHDEIEEMGYQPAPFSNAIEHERNLTRGEHDLYDTAELRDMFIPLGGDGMTPSAGVSTHSGATPAAQAMLANPESFDAVTKSIRLRETMVDSPVLDRYLEELKPVWATVGNSTRGTRVKVKKAKGEVPYDTLDDAFGIDLARALDLKLNNKNLRDAMEGSDLDKLAARLKAEATPYLPEPFGKALATRVETDPAIAQLRIRLREKNATLGDRDAVLQGGDDVGASVAEGIKQTRVERAAFADQQMGMPEVIAKIGESKWGQQKARADNFKRNFKGESGTKIKPDELLDIEENYLRYKENVLRFALGAPSGRLVDEVVKAIMVRHSISRTAAVGMIDSTKWARIDDVRLGRQYLEQALKDIADDPGAWKRLDPAWHGSVGPDKYDRDPSHLAAWDQEVDTWLDGLDEYVELRKAKARLDAGAIDAAAPTTIDAPDLMASDWSQRWAYFEGHTTTLKKITDIVGEGNLDPALWELEQLIAVSGAFDRTGHAVLRDFLDEVATGIIARRVAADADATITAARGALQDLQYGRVRRKVGVDQFEDLPPEDAARIRADLKAKRHPTRPAPPTTRTSTGEPTAAQAEYQARRAQRMAPAPDEPIAPITPEMAATPDDVSGLAEAQVDAINPHTSAPDAPTELGDDLAAALEPEPAVHGALPGGGGSGAEPPLPPNLPLGAMGGPEDTWNAWEEARRRLMRMEPSARKRAARASGIDTAHRSDDDIVDALMERWGTLQRNGIEAAAGPAGRPAKTAEKALAETQALVDAIHHLPPDIKRKLTYAVDQPKTTYDAVGLDDEALEELFGPLFKDLGTAKELRNVVDRLRKDHSTGYREVVEWAVKEALDGGRRQPLQIITIVTDLDPKLRPLLVHAPPSWEKKLVTGTRESAKETVRAAVAEGWGHPSVAPFLNEQRIGHVSLRTGESLATTAGDTGETWFPLVFSQLSANHLYDLLRQDKGPAIVQDLIDYGLPAEQVRVVQEMFARILTPEMNGMPAGHEVLSMGFATRGDDLPMHTLAAIDGTAFADPAVAKHVADALAASPTLTATLPSPSIAHGYVTVEDISSLSPLRDGSKRGVGDAARTVVDNDQTATHALLSPLELYGVEPAGITHFIQDADTGAWIKGVGPDVIRNDNQAVQAEELLDLLWSGSHPNYRIAGSLADGTFSPAVMAGVPIEDLPKQLYAPPKQVKTPDGKWDRFVNYNFDKISKFIDAGVRHPRYINALADALRATDGLYDSLLDARLVHRGDQALAAALDNLAAMKANFVMTDAHRSGERALPKWMSKTDEHTFGMDDLRDSWADLSERQRQLVRDDPSKLQGEIAKAQAGARDADGGFASYFLAGADEQQTIDLVGYLNADYNAENVVQQIAATRAMDDVAPYIDDASVRSLWQVQARNIVPFEFATEAFLKRWVRTLINEPVSLRRAQLLAHSVTASAWTDEDENGEMVVTIPMSESLTSLFANSAVTKAIFGHEMSIPTGVPMQMRVDRMLPGVPGDLQRLPGMAPVGQIPAGVLATQFPEMHDPYISLFDSPPGMFDPSTIFPTWSRRLAGGMFNIDSAEMSAATVGAMQMMESNSLQLYAEARDAERRGDLAEANRLNHEASLLAMPDNSDPGELDRYLGEMRAIARVLLVTRGAMGFTTPAQPSANTDTTLLRKEFVEMLAVADSFEAALSSFLMMHPEGGPYTVFESESVSGSALAPTDEALAWFDEGNHRDYLEQFQFGGAWLLPQARSDEPINRAVYDELIARGFRRRRTPKEWAEAYQFAGAAGVYFDSKSIHDAEMERLADDPDAKRQAEASWRVYSERFMNQHPTFASQLGGKARPEREQALVELRIIMADPNRPEFEHEFETQMLLENFERFEQDVAAYATDKSKRAADARRAMRRSFAEFGEAFIKEYPHMDGMWRTLIVPAAGIRQDVELPGGRAMEAAQQ